MRAAVDRFFVAGVNHIVYHGTAYSPVGDPWPGWQFYASVEFNPRNAWWDDFAALNAYVARVQSFLQSGRPDHDVLLYYPFYESLAVRGKTLLAHFGGAAPPAQGTTFEKAAETTAGGGLHLRLHLRSSGAPAADRATAADHDRRRRRRIATIVLPSARYVPLETVLQILELARQRRDGRVVRRTGRPT